MNSKERKLCAVDLQLLDRAPMDFSANEATLKRLYSDFKVTDHMELLKYLKVDILDMRGVIDPIYKGPIAKHKVLDDGTKQNYWGMKTKTMDAAKKTADYFIKNYQMIKYVIGI